MLLCVHALQDPSKPPKMSDQEIIEFIFFPVVNEGCRCVQPCFFVRVCAHVVEVCEC